MSQHWQATAVFACFQARNLPWVGGAGGLSAFFGLPLASAFLVLEATAPMICCTCTLDSCLRAGQGATRGWCRICHGGRLPSEFQPGRSDLLDSPRRDPCEATAVLACLLELTGLASLCRCKHHWHISWRFHLASSIASWEQHFDSTFVYWFLPGAVE